MSDRTIYINGRFLTQPITGVQRYALELLQAMDSQLASLSASNQGMRFELLSPPGSLVHEPIFARIRHRRVGRLSGQLWEQFELPIHSRDGMLFSPCNATPLLKRRRVVTVHDAAVFTFPEAYSIAFSVWYRYLLRQICRSNAKIITVSEFSRSELIDKAGLHRDRSKVIYHGFEHIRRLQSDIGVLDRLELREKPFALAVSSHNLTKNFHGLASALDRLREPNFTVVVVGGKNSRIFSDKSYRWPSFVKLAGYVSDAELRALYEYTTCFIFPSLYEGFGIPPLEALACGAPVLAADIPPLREVYGSALKYFDPNDPQSIAEKLVESMRNPERDEAAVDGCLRSLTWERCAHETIDFLQKA